MSEEKNISLNALIEGCIRKERAAQEAMYRHFYPLMMPVCMGYAKQKDDAVDIYNRSFLKVFTKLRDFNGQGSFEGWVRRIVVHTAIDHLRSEERSRQSVDINEVNYLATNDNPMDKVMSEDVLRLMQQLPPVQRMVVNLYIVEGYNHQEIAEKLDIQPGTSKWHLSEGRKKLKTLLTKAGIAH